MMRDSVSPCRFADQSDAASPKASESDSVTLGSDASATDLGGAYNRAGPRPHWSRWLRSAGLAAILLAALLAGLWGLANGGIAGVAAAPESTLALSPTVTTILSDNPDPSVAGEPVTMRFTVTGSSLLTGTVSVIGGYSQCTATLPVAPFASCVLTPQLSGALQFTATYQGNSTNETSFDTESHQVDPATTHSTMGAGSTSLSCGQVTVLTATVTVDPPASPAAKPAPALGSFYDGSTLLGTATTFGGVASLTLTPTVALGIGGHNLHFEYAGTPDFGASTSPDVVATVGPADTSVVVSSNINPSVVGQVINLLARVSAVFPGTGTPNSGTVTFEDNGTPIGAPVPVNGVGEATLGTAPLDVGTHPIVATYNGNSCYDNNSSATYNQIVNTALTTTTLTTSANPAIVGLPLVLTAQVDVAPPADGIPTGVITFTDAFTVLGVVPVDNDRLASLVTSSLTVGLHGLMAEYSGDADFNTSQSNIIIQVVERGTTTTSLSGAPASTVYGQAAAFTAHVASTSIGVPTGQVMFYNNGNYIDSAPLNGSGNATITEHFLGVGPHSITALYNGDASFDGSASSPLSHPVSAATTTTTMTAAPNPSVCNQSVTLGATVVTDAPGGGIPQGSVTFKDGGSTIGTGTLGAGGQASLVTSFAAGSHSLTAQYTGSANHSASTSSSLSQTVNPITTSTAVATSRNPSALTFPVTFTATVVAVAPGAGIPTGMVTFKDGGSTIGVPVALDGTGHASISTSALAAGSHVITANYAGTSCYAASIGTLSPNQVVRQETDMSVAATDSPDPVRAGTNLTYVITVTNNSTLAAQVTMTSALPAGMPYVSTTPAGGWSCSGTTTVVCSKASLAAGASGVTTIVINVPAATAANTLLTNNVSVGSTSFDTNTSNNTVAVQTVVYRTRFYSPDPVPIERD